MLWGSFGTIHLLSLAFAAALVVGIGLCLRGRSDRTKLAVLGVLSFAGIAAILFNLLTWGSPLEYLPFHLCSLTAMVLPFAVFTRGRVLNNLLLLWSLGALLALVVNTAQADYEIFSWTFFFYFFPHTLELGIPILMFSLGLVKKDLRCIGSTAAITFAVYTAVHLINVALNTYCIENNVLDYAGNVIQVNYMYSIRPENPVLQLFYNLLPQPYWYMLPVLLVILLYLGAVYAKEFAALLRRCGKRAD